MKISKKNTALNYLDNGDELICSTAEATKDVAHALKFLQQEFALTRSKYRAKIQFVCDSFHKAYLKSWTKMETLFATEDISQSGTLLLGGNTVFYDLERLNCKWNKATVLVFWKKRDAPEPYLWAYYNQSEKDCSQYTLGINGGIENHLSAEQWLAIVTSLQIFTKYCDVETKHIQANRKDHHKGEKYVNETGNGIEILDSTWFTTIVRSEGFMVGDESGGFLRWQPVGPDRTDRKLIWVEPFPKNGYTRKARISE